jgi:hypothetical protein
MESTTMNKANISSHTRNPGGRGNILVRNVECYCLEQMETLWLQKLEKSNAVRTVKRHSERSNEKRELTMVHK